MLTHRYAGLSRDAALYAFQALARLQPNLRSDIYLAFNSQDNYTIFSPIYAWFIEHCGLQAAEFALYTFCLALYLTAAYLFSLSQFGKTAAWLSTSALLVVSSHYGAYGVFSFFDDYLTARSLAVGMIAVAIALFHSRFCGPAFLVAIAAMFVHPLMALPGLILLTYWLLSIRTSVTVTLMGCVAAFLMAAAAANLRIVGRHLPLLDADWLEVVQERSQFLFLKFWRSSDWELTARPFVSLTLTSLVIAERHVRKLCLAAMMVGASGLLVAWISGGVGPVAALVQGQAWRWVWVTGFVALLLLPPTVMLIWRDRACGPLCALLLTLAWIWTYSRTDVLLLSDLALGLWLARHLISDRVSRMLRWAAAACAMLAAGVTGQSILDIVAAKHGLTSEDTWVDYVREFFGLGVSSTLVALGLCWLTSSCRSTWVIVTTLAGSVILSITLTSHSLGQTHTVAATLFDDFADWRAVIPPKSAVLLVPVPTTAALAWFTLQRPSYMSVDQSAGVVFSRETASEVRRRSNVLLAVMEPDWRLLTQITRKQQGKPPQNTPPRPLTSEALSTLCEDQALGFVGAKENVGFPSHRHVGGDPWDQWNLYDCREVRQHTPT